MWHVTNNKLYSGSGTGTPVFIVGTSFNFGDSLPTEWSVDVDARINRAAAGNAVYVFGAYLAAYTNGVPASYDGISGGQRVVDLISQNPLLSYFTYY